MSLFFLDKIPPCSDAKWTAMASEYSNWLRIAKLIYSTTNRTPVLRLLQIELCGQRRPMIVKRLYQRFSALRATTEFSAILTQFKEPVYPDPETKARYDATLETWNDALKYVNTLDVNPLPEIKNLIHHECHNKRRRYVLHRLYTKYCTIRRRMELQGMQYWRPRGK